MSITVREYSAASGTHYWTAQNASGQWWNGSAFEAYNASNWTTYVITATSFGNGWYSGSLNDSSVTYGLRFRVSGTAATTDPLIAYGNVTTRANVEQYGGTAGTFSGGRPEVNTVRINGDSAAAGGLLYYGRLVTGAAASLADVGSTTTSVNLQSPPADYAPFVYGTIVDSVTGERALILGGFGSTVTVDGFTNAPANGSTLYLVPPAYAPASLVRVKDQDVSASATVTFPATIASTTNIAGGMITTVSGNVNGSVGSISGVTFPTGFSNLTVANIQSGLSTLTASGVRAAIGLATANLDTQLSGIASDAADAASGAGGGGGTGNGDIAVDHNWGGTDTYRFTISGVPQDNVVIRAYVQDDYDAGTIDANPPMTTTGSDGRWIAPLMLDEDVYLLTAYNPATKRTDTIRDVEVSQ